MKRLHTIAKLIVVLALLYLPLFAQSLQAGINHFSKDGLAFDYPTGWVLTDKSSPQAQHLILSRPDNSVLIMVIAYRDLITSPQQIGWARTNIAEPFVEDIARKFGDSGTSPERDSFCTKVGEHVITGYRLRAKLDGKPSTAEIYPFVLGRRFVNLVYIRVNNDEPSGTPVWETVRSTMNIDAPPSEKSEVELLLVQNANVLNGRAVKLPKPEYPSAARAARASGTITVQVTLDEGGNVITAHALTGHPALREASEEAAKRAKFAPTTICGEPVKVTGLITYNFVGP